MTERILVSAYLPPAEVEYLRAQISQAEVRFIPQHEVTAQDLSWAQVVFGNIDPVDLLVSYTNIKWLHSPNVGMDMYASLGTKPPDLQISNTTGIVDHAVSEHALALLLALTRLIPLIAQGQSRREWICEAYSTSFAATTIAEKQVHVLGYGQIARCLIAKLAGLSMQVTVYRRKGIGSDPSVARFLSFRELSSHAHEADVLISVLPDRPEVRGLISATVLGHMKSTAFLVNVGRGSVLNEPALVEALKRKAIAGAALDVFAEEPIPDSSSLWDLPNVLISPHVAGRFDREMHRHAAAFLSRLEEWRKRKT
jgi:phosphoglycerate dehydrogenase-like enzyme